MSERSKEVETGKARDVDQDVAARDVDGIGGALGIAGVAALSGVFAPPDGPDGRGLSGAGRSVLAAPAVALRLQRLSGNGAVGSLVSRCRPSSAPITVQRQSKDVGIKDVKLSAGTVTIPLESGLSLKATAVPKNATDVKFSVEKGSVDATGVTIDAKTGDITIGAQQGGTVKVKATAKDGSFSWSDLRIIEKPTGIASTTAVPAGGNEYGGKFTHTFNAPSGKSSGLEGANINEKFDSSSSKTPFGKGKVPFTLEANRAGSKGWDLDSTGAMAGPDNVTHGKGGVDIGKFLKSASNVAPEAQLPQGFSMTQHLHAKSLPSGKRDAAALTDVQHVRTLTPNARFVVEAGKNKIEDEYAGPPAYTNAKAAPASVEASPPKPAAPKGGSAPTWNRNKVQVSCDVFPTSAKKVFALVGAKLGCEIDKATGEVLIGDQPGSIKVRVSDGAGKNFDEVTITITPAKPKPPSGQKTGLLEPMDETGGPITEPEEVQAMVQTLAEDTTGFPRAEPVGGSRARARRADRS